LAAGGFNLVEANPQRRIDDLFEGFAQFRRALLRFDSHIGIERQGGSHLEIMMLHSNVSRWRSMNDSFSLCGGQTVRDLQRVLDGLAHRQRRAVHFLTQCFAFEQFTHEIKP